MRLKQLLRQFSDLSGVDVSSITDVDYLGFYELYSVHMGVLDFCELGVSKELFDRYYMWVKTNVVLQHRRLGERQKNACRYAIIYIWVQALVEGRVGQGVMERLQLIIPVEFNVVGKYHIILRYLISTGKFMAEVRMTQISVLHNFKKADLITSIGDVLFEGTESISAEGKLNIYNNLESTNTIGGVLTKQEEDTRERDNGKHCGCGAKDRAVLQSEFSGACGRSSIFVEAKRAFRDMVSSKTIAGIIIFLIILVILIGVVLWLI